MRRHLGLSVEAGEALVWWEYRLLVEGLTFDEERQTHAVIRSALGAKLVEQEPPEPDFTGGQATLEELAAMGIGVG